MVSVVVGGWNLQFYAEAVEFLAAAGDHLAADPLVSTVVTGFAHQAVSAQSEGIPPPERDWWLVVRDAQGAVVGAGMRSASFAPYPPYLLPMPDDAAIALAVTLHERGEEVRGINGALPAVERCAAELARLRGGRVEVAQHTRLHQLEELVQPATTPGQLLAATEDDVEMVTAWLAAFMGDADEQAGRPRGSSAHAMPERGATVRRLRAGELWFWVDDTGRRVHLTGVRTPAYGVARVGPVYTPPAERGRGWASSAVAEVSRRFLTQGVRVCLFTDQANPTSNKIYAALGYRPVVDMANLVIG